MTLDVAFSAYDFSKPLPQESSVDPYLAANGTTCRPPDWEDKAAKAMDELAPKVEQGDYPALLSYQAQLLDYAQAVDRKVAYYAPEADKPVDSASIAGIASLASFVDVRGLRGNFASGELPEKSVDAAMRHGVKIEFAALKQARLELEELKLKADKGFVSTCLGSAHGRLNQAAQAWAGQQGAVEAQGYAKAIDEAATGVATVLADQDALKREMQQLARKAQTLGDSIDPAKPLQAEKSKALKGLIAGLGSLNQAMQQRIALAK